MTLRSHFPAWNWPNQPTGQARTVKDWRRLHGFSPDAPRRLRDRPALDGFALESEMGGQKLWLDYYVTRQAGGGVTVAARLVPNDLSNLRREVDRIARSITVTKRITEPKATKKR